MDISDIFTQLQREKERKNLEKLQKDFYIKVSEMIKKYKKQLELYKVDSKEYRELNSTIYKIKEAIYELINLRIEKIINMSLLEVRENLNAVPEENLEEEEKIFYKIIKNLLNSFKENIENKIVEGEEVNINKFYEDIGKNINIAQNKINKEILIIKNELPKIVGPNGKIYGPFKIGDILIIEKNLAEKMENVKIGRRIS
jgi:DNA replication factor GINS